MTRAAEIRELVAAQLAAIDDETVREGLRACLVDPELHVREWDYGTAGQVFDCWYVAKDPDTAMALAYSEHGFGPRNPWGIVGTSDRAFGMDSGWFRRLEDAFVDALGDELPIWDLVVREADGADRVLAAARTLREAYALREQRSAGDADRSHHVVYRSRPAGGVP